MTQYSSYANKNLEGMLDIVENEDNIIMVGTGRDEITRTYKDLHSQLEQDIDQAD